MNLFPLAVIAAVALAACTKPEMPVAPTTPTPAAPAPEPVPAQVSKLAPAPATVAAQLVAPNADEPKEGRGQEPATIGQAQRPAKAEPPPPAKVADDCEALATSKEGRAAVMRFAEADLKGIIARKAMETFPVPARLQIASLLSSGEVKAAENYELIYTPVAAELVRETDKGVVCRVSTEFHADGTIAYSGEGNDGTTKVKEAPAKLEAKRDLYLKTTRRLDGGTQIEVVAL